MTKGASAWLLASLLGAGASGSALGQSPAGDAGMVFLQVPLTALEVGDAALPPRWGGHWREHVPATVVLDGGGEAYVSDPAGSERAGARATAESSLVMRATAGTPISGRLTLPRADGPGADAFDFAVVRAVPDEPARASFHRAKARHYEALQQRDLSGAAWFRHRARQARAALGDAPDAAPARQRRRPQRGTLEASYELFSGARAVSENLQLDRLMGAPGADGEWLDVGTLPGITVAPYDFAARVAGKQIAVDPLARLIPADQHALFFSSFGGLLRVIDEIDHEQGTLVLGMLEPRAEDVGVLRRYQRQLALPLSELARKLGGLAVKSVAWTGSDPYLPMGTDVAVLLETAAPALLHAFVAGRQGLAAQQRPDAETVAGEIDGVAYRAVITPDRALSSYVALLPEAVAVTNSPAQLRRLLAVQAGRAPALATLPEYRFFRDRYPLSDPRESAFLVLSDATIRRWCSARWRIGDSRRTRAAAVLAELQATHLDALDAAAPPGPLRSALPLPGPRAGELLLDHSGVRSSVYGTLGFLTPVAELKIDQVSKSEAEQYRRWRRGYQRNWNGLFDPIAMSISLSDEGVATDLTVLPLILGSEYNSYIDVTRGARIDPADGDPHAGSLAHLALSLNRESGLLRQLQGMSASMAPTLRIDPLGWLGSSVALYVDDDPVWGELAAREHRRVPWEDSEHLPVALHADVANPFKLAAFLTALHVYADQSAPGLVQWETRRHQDQPYVRVGSGDGPAVYYAATAEALVVTPSEATLRRALERLAARRAGGAAAVAGMPWLGENLALQLQRGVLDLVFRTKLARFRERVRAQCWGNLPILNEWRARFPGRDPLAFHRRHWGAALRCAGGGSYAWDEQARTMTSTVFGHPAAPRPGPDRLPGTARWQGANFGLTFEDDGLRARAALTFAPVQ